jgi:hypothetical protein
LWSGTANGTYALNLVPGGMCDGFTCTDGGKKAYYVGAGESKSDTKIYVIDSDSHTSKPLSSFSDSSFFSVRCAKLSTQVKKGSDLSACDTKEKIMVQEDSSTYTCIYGKWFKEVYREPECSKSTEGSTYYKIRPMYAKTANGVNLRNWKSGWATAPAPRKMQPPSTTTPPTFATPSPGESRHFSTPKENATSKRAAIPYTIMA